MIRPQCLTEAYAAMRPSGLKAMFVVRSPVRWGRPPLALGDYTTLAYSARTGARLWVRRYGGRLSNDFALSLAVSPGGTVLVTGTIRYGAYATVAYSPGGAQLWARRYNGPGSNPPPGGVSDIAYAVAAPGNRRVYVTGTSWGGSAYDYATIAYNIRAGARLWVRRYNGPANLFENASSIAARGGRVFVAGTTSGDYVTIAYNS